MIEVGSCEDDAEKPGKCKMTIKMFDFLIKKFQITVLIFRHPHPSWTMLQEHVNQTNTPMQDHHCADKEECRKEQKVRKSVKKSAKTKKTNHIWKKI